MRDMIRVWVRAAIPLLASLVFTPPANADGFYFGAGAYRAEVEIGSFDDSDTTSALFVGYTFIDSIFMLSGELGRYDLGSYSSGGSEVDGDATSLAAVLYLPLGPTFELYGKAGIASIDADVDGSSEDEDEMFTGIGFGLDIFDTVDFYAEYLEFDTDIDFDMIGVGIRLDF